MDSPAYEEALDFFDINGIYPEELEQDCYAELPWFEDEDF